MSKQFTDRTNVALNSPISENIRKKMGKFDYLPSAIVFKTLNDLFTPSGWSSEVIETTILEKIFYKNGNREMVKIVAMATVKVSINGYTSHMDVSTGTGVSNASDIGGAYDTSIKGAVSTAHTRACRKLGSLFGLDLYKEAKMAMPLHDSFLGANNHPDDQATQKVLINPNEVKPTILRGENLLEQEYQKRLMGVISYLGESEKMGILKYSKEEIELAVSEVTKND